MIVIPCKCRYFIYHLSCRRNNKKFLQVRSCPIENLGMNDLDMKTHCKLFLIVSFSIISMMVFKYRCEGNTLQWISFVNEIFSFLWWASSKLSSSQDTYNRFLCSLASFFRYFTTKRPICSTWKWVINFGVKCP